MNEKGRKRRVIRLLTSERCNDVNRDKDDCVFEREGRRRSVSCVYCVVCPCVVPLLSMGQLKFP